MWIRPKKNTHHLNRLMDRMQVLKNDHKFTILRLLFYKIKGTQHLHTWKSFILLLCIALVLDFAATNVYFICVVCSHWANRTRNTVTSISTKFKLKALAIWKKKKYANIHVRLLTWSLYLCCDFSICIFHLRSFKLCVISKCFECCFPFDS